MLKGGHDVLNACGERPLPGLPGSCMHITVTCVSICICYCSYANTCVTKADETYLKKFIFMKNGMLWKDNKGESRWARKLKD